jgi:hypothetical protein
VALDTNSDEIEIEFTSSEGEIDFEFSIGDFDNPYTTTEWGDFEIEVKELSDADGEFYGVSSGTGFKMAALTDPYTISATIIPSEGVIEEEDTIEIYFEISGAKILEDCQFEIVLPDDISFDSGSAKAKGKGCFAYSTSSTSIYATLSSSSKFDFTWPSSGGGGTIRGEGLCPSQIYDLECYMQIQGVVMPDYVQTTETFQLYLYDSNNGLIGQQTTGLSILDTQLTAGEISLDSFTSDNTEVQEDGVTFTISFTPEHTVLDTTQIIIQWPTDIPLSASCSASPNIIDADSSTCDRGTGEIIFASPFSSNKGTGFQIEVEVSTGTNPESVRDAGTVEISIKQEDDNGDYQLKDQYSGSSGYAPTSGSVFKASSQSGGGIGSDSYVTYQDDAVYTFYIETEHDVES